MLVALKHDMITKILMHKGKGTDILMFTKSKVVNNTYVSLCKSKLFETTSQDSL